MLRIGHRGAKGYAPENTLASFQKAIDLNVDGIELDVHLSTDDEIIVIHDPTLNRTTNGNGFVNALSLLEIKAVTIDGKHEIPTLAEVFDLVNKQCFINIELKDIATTKPVVQLIEKYIQANKWNYDHFIISSFDWNALKQVVALSPKIKIGVLAEINLNLALAFAEFINANAIHPYFHLLDIQNSEEILKKGFQIYPWTVNEYEDIAKIKSFNVSGIISDFVDRIL